MHIWGPMDPLSLSALVIPFIAVVQEMSHFGTLCDEFLANLRIFEVLEIFKIFGGFKGVRDFRDFLEILGILEIF